MGDPKEETRRPRLQLRPLTFAQANELVRTLHRHHRPVQGMKFAVGVFEGERFVGAAIAGRPVARKTDAARVLEVTRLVTDGTKNACSILYAAVARAAAALGYEKVQTFILDTESGVSLKAAGWAYDGDTPGRSWNVPSRGGRREDSTTLGKKKRYVKVLSA